MKDFMETYLKEISDKIKPGNNFTLYLLYCKACNEYKRITASPPAGPGGTLGCPLCRERKQNGPHLEGQYGRIVVNTFIIKLPKEVET